MPTIRDVNVAHFELKDKSGLKNRDYNLFEVPFRTPRRAEF